jgi:hypothetical protein
MSGSQTIPPAGNLGYAVLDGQNNVLTYGWMPVAQWLSAMPAGAIAITDAQLRMMVMTPGSYIFTNGTLALVPTPPSIAAVQEASRTQIDAAAERCRGQFITSGLGQMLVYQAKAAQASAFLAAYPTDAAAASATINPNNWPLLQDEIGITGPDLWSVAAAVAAIQAAWLAIAAMIEQIRLGTKAAINKATDATTISALVTGTVFPTAGQPAMAAPSSSLLALAGGIPAITVA